MKATHLMLIALLLSTLISCRVSSKVKDFDDRTINHQRIAVLPFESTITLKEKQREKISDEELATLNLAQGKEVQNAVETYLINCDLRVRIQSQSVTNARLTEAGINLATIRDYDVTKLAEILKVDAVVTGKIKTEKPMSNALASGLNIARQVIRQSESPTGFITSRINTTTNRGSCSVGLFESIEGDRLWYYREDINCGEGSETIDVIESLMRRGARRFPYSS